MEYNIQYICCMRLFIQQLYYAFIEQPPVDVLNSITLLRLESDCEYCGKDAWPDACVSYAVCKTSHWLLSHKSWQLTQRLVWNYVINTMKQTISLEQCPSSGAYSYSAIKGIPPFHGTRNFIKAYIISRCWVPSWVRWVQPSLTHTISLR
jgi:hypothetical protein